MSDGIEQKDNSEPVLRLRSEELDWLPVEDEVVALDGRRDLYLGTNDSGAHMWRALGEGATRSQLVDLLVKTFEIDTARAAADTDAFIQALEEHNLLEET